MIPLARAAALLAAFAVTSTLAAQPPQLPPPEKTDEKPEPGVKVLDKGPIHEAFAQPGADVRGKGMTAPKAPPPAVTEVPPDTKPDGDNVRWVPGYWLWDADQKDFVWVSGFWRNTPPGREWQAGEWKKAANGDFAYTPGFWKPANMNSWRVDLPEPPKSLETGPTTPPGDPNALWVPGAWEFRNEQYVWRPGYWASPNGDQLWQPPQYRATPYGYSYVPGYWDYPLEDRGLLYAPVYFNQPLYLNPGYSYRPRFALGLGFGYGGYGYGGLFSSLYIGPGYNNYYYGNYWPYGGTWLGVGNPLWSGPFGFGSPLFGLGFYGGYGYSPWYAYGRGFYNPTWQNYCWLNRNNPNYCNQAQQAVARQSMGLPPMTARLVAPSPTVGGAATTAVRAATAVVTPRPPAANAPLVQPASQVARSLSAATNRPPTTSPAAPAVGRPTVQPSGGAAVRSGGAGGGTGVTAIPQLHGLQNAPTHVGSAGLSGGLGTQTAPRLGNIPPPAASSMVSPRLPGGTITNPSVGLSPQRPITSPAVPQIRYGNPAASAPLGRMIPSSPNITAPSMRAPALHTPAITAPSMPAPGLRTPAIAAPSMRAPGIQTPGIGRVGGPVGGGPVGGGGRGGGAPAGGGGGKGGKR